MTDRKITLQLTPTQVGYVTGALRRCQNMASGAASSLVHMELNELLATIQEQVTDDTLQGAGLDARLWERERFGRELTPHERALRRHDPYEPPEDMQDRLAEYEHTEATCSMTGLPCLEGCTGVECAGMHTPLNQWPT